MHSKQQTKINLNDLDKLNNIYSLHLADMILILALTLKIIFIIKNFILGSFGILSEIVFLQNSHRRNYGHFLRLKHTHIIDGLASKYGLMLIRTSLVTDSKFRNIVSGFVVRFLGFKHKRCKLVIS